MSQSQAVYRVLARKYRPQTLSDLKGQEILSKTLEKAISENRIPHAFLFHGIRGVGKTTTARILAKALNCIGEDGKGPITCNPCGKCASCIAIVEDRHLDVIEMDAASHTGVDDIREIVDACRYKAVQGRFKVFIIDEVHMLSKSAFNALLKTLEEPPSHVKFIFATTELRKIPDTILSRCQRFDLKRMDIPLLIEYLGEIAQKEGFEASPLALSMLSKAADGSMRDGLSLLDQAISLTQANSEKTIEQETIRQMLGQSDRSMLLDLLEYLLKGNVQDSLKISQYLLNEGSDPLLLLQDVLDLVFSLTTLKTQKVKPNFVMTGEDLTKIEELSNSIPVSVMLQSWQVLVKGYEELLKSPLQAETLQMILIRLCYVVPISVLDFEDQKKKSKLAPPPITFQDDASKDSDHGGNIHTLEDLLNILETEKEMVIHSALRHDTHIVSFKKRHIVLRVKDNVKNTFILPLKNFLDSFTNTNWIVEQVFEGGDKTIIQKQQDKQKVLEDEAKNQPIVCQVLKAFPNSMVTIVNNT
ncbi:MAG: DNA polymerase III subunit gamma/tau [Proteobacteria bacterium]|nr:DNA polymerase III subunit gamma/tau [Pseudomonadota bacterium]